MAVRRIPKNHLVVTGAFASRKCAAMAQFESLLEKDYMLLLDFDERVETFEAQPVRIPVPGVPQGYVPDVLVHFHADPDTGEIPPPLLVEVKHTADLHRNAAKYAAKFAAARDYAAHQGWQFAIIDQTQIRTPRLDNLKFLRAYREVQLSNDDESRVLLLLQQQDGASFADVVEQLASSEAAKLHWMAVLWAMVAQQKLHTCLDEPLSQQASLKLPCTAAARRAQR